MLQCSIIGCGNSFSEILGSPIERKKWFVGTAEDWPQLAALRMAEEPSTLPTNVQKVVLCPAHRKAVFDEILEIRKLQKAD